MRVRDCVSEERRRGATAVSTPHAGSRTTRVMTADDKTVHPPGTRNKAVIASGVSYFAHSL